MDLQTVINLAWLKAQGEPFVDGFSSDNGKYLVGLAQYYVRYFATQSGVNWVSLYDPLYQIATVKAGDSFTFDATQVRKFSDQPGDYIRVQHKGTANYTDYTLIQGNRLQSYAQQNACARVGKETLKFSYPFTADSVELGGKIVAPVYLFPEIPENEDDIVQVDNELWLIAIMAYDIALHDILRKDIAGNLLGEATDLFESMKEDNETAQENMTNNFDMSNIGG